MSGRVALRSARQFHPWVFFLPIAASLALAVMGPADLTLLECGLGLFLLLLPCVLLEMWRRGPRNAPPFLAMITGMYWVYYAFPVFWGERSVVMWSFLDVPMEGAALQSALVMASLGVGCLALGYLSRVDRLLPQRWTLNLGSGSQGMRYLIILMAVNLAAASLPGARYILGSGGRQIMFILIDTVGLVVFVLFFRRWLRGNSSPVERLLLVLFLTQRVILNAASGVLGSVLQLLVVAGLAYILEKGRLPVAPVLAASLLFLFLQAGKDEFRSVYWTGAEQSSAIERVEFWVSSSAYAWGEALTDTSGTNLRRLLSFIFSRVSLLSQTANVVSMTPAVVPHQGSELYYYMSVTLIPRLIWPDKPSVNEANRFYQVAYGMSLEKDLENVSIAVGILAEAYIAFGWLGVIGMMYASGVLLRIFFEFLLAVEGGFLLQSVGIVLLVPLLAIEGQFAQYFGGLAQHVFLTLLVFVPVLHWQKRTTSARLRPTPVSHPRALPS